MKNCLLSLILWPCLLNAQGNQPVYPVVTPAYLKAISEDTGVFRNDSSISVFKLTPKLPYIPTIKEIRIRGNEMNIIVDKNQQIGISGKFINIIEIQKANREPKLQKLYVQGRNSGGSPQWRGAELDEAFSFGPAITSLAYGTGNYPYDINGPLVPRAGNLDAARVYDNSIIRTGLSVEQQLNLAVKYYEQERAKIKTQLSLSNSDARHIIEKNKSHSGAINFSFDIFLPKYFVLRGNYSFQQLHNNNPNRSGFLNRVYQQSLLTPISFENAQGYHLGAAQRRFNNASDNPLFLLNESDNSQNLSHHRGRIELSRRFMGHSVWATATFENNTDNLREGFAAGSALFPAGNKMDRKQNDKNYRLNLGADLDIDMFDQDFQTRLKASLLSDHLNTDIIYRSHANAYQYKRNLTELDLKYELNYDGYSFPETTVGLDNRIFVSSTTKDRWWLPSVTAKVKISSYRPEITVGSSWSRNSTELPLHQSLAYAGLFQHNLATDIPFFPVTELSGFKTPKPVDYSEWNLNLNGQHNGTFFLDVTFYNRWKRNDIFPILENDEIVLRNIASHRTRGIEITARASSRYRYRGVNVAGRVTFDKWANKVTSVIDGYENYPIAGFSNLFKTISTGQPLGAIMGSAFRRDASGNIIIGSDGFPLVDNNLKIIGNPIPDFTVKYVADLSYKTWKFSINVEWRKGGQTWNGTQAFLDYYGRSMNSALFRNTRNYIFRGVLENGQQNNTPVAFYDNSSPVENNRWTRYGQGGIAEEYIKSSSQVRIPNLSLSHRFSFRKGIQGIEIGAFASNLIIWSAYRGVDPGIRTLFDQGAATGLDYFNLPGYKTFGFTTSITF